MMRLTSMECAVAGIICGALSVLVFAVVRAVRRSRRRTGREARYEFEGVLDQNDMRMGPSQRWSFAAMLLVTVANSPSLFLSYEYTTGTVSFIAAIQSLTGLIAGGFAFMLAYGALRGHLLRVCEDRAEAIYWMDREMVLRYEGVAAVVMEVCEAADRKRWAVIAVIAGERRLLAISKGVTEADRNAMSPIADALRQALEEFRNRVNI